MYTYAAFNNDTKTKVMNGTQLDLTFEFRDWKYLSQIEQFAVKINDT